MKLIHTIGTGRGSKPIVDLILLYYVMTQSAAGVVDVGSEQRLGCGAGCQPFQDNSPWLAPAAIVLADLDGLG